MYFRPNFETAITSVATSVMYWNIPGVASRVSSAEAESQMARI
jgi:hypothetical protein